MWWRSRELIGIRVSVCLRRRRPGVGSLGSTYFIGASVDEASGGLHALVEEFGGLLADGVGTAHLDIGVA